MTYDRQFMADCCYNQVDNFVHQNVSFVCESGRRNSWVQIGSKRPFAVIRGSSATMCSNRKNEGQRIVSWGVTNRLRCRVEPQTASG